MIFAMKAQKMRRYFDCLILKKVAKMSIDMNRIGNKKLRKSKGFYA